jgi:hypothetical protein
MSKKGRSEGDVDSDCRPTDMRDQCSVYPEYVIYYRLDSKEEEASKKEVYRQELEAEEEDEENTDEEDEEWDEELSNEEGEGHEGGERLIELAEQIRHAADSYNCSPEMQQFIHMVMNQTARQRERSAPALSALRSLFSGIAAPQNMDALQEALHSPQVHMALEQWRQALTSSPQPTQPSMPAFNNTRRAEEPSRP